MARLTDLDQKIQILARTLGAGDCSADARDQRVKELTDLSAEFDALATAAGMDLRGSAFEKLAQPMQQQLARLLGVPLRPEFYWLLERKAEEYHEQGIAFDRVASEFGFEEGCALGRHERRGALVLTHNGSLIQLSAPDATHLANARRDYIYQSIYRNGFPAEGTLTLLEAVQRNAPLMASKLNTSPVRKLRLATTSGNGGCDRKTFARISVALAPSALPSRPVDWGAAREWFPAVRAKSIAQCELEVERLHIDRLGDVARLQLRDLIVSFGNRSKDKRHTLDVDILGLCIYLQRLRIERGVRGFFFHDIETVVTDRGERITACGSPKPAFAEKNAGLLRVDRLGKATEFYQGASLGDQRIAVGAPIALLDEGGSIAAILGDVVEVTPRAAF
ncbi:MAG: hypothetical protein NVS3B20_16790 [Polyangiales bacterium]